MLVYVINEESTLDADSLRKNEKLKSLIELKLKYKFPFLILLSHSDTYCYKVKENEKEWEKICKVHINNNKKYLLEYINELIEKEYKSNFKMNENDIMHIVLVEPEKLSDEDLIKKLDPKIKERYDKARSEDEKKFILEIFHAGRSSTTNEVKDFLEKDMNILGSKELIKKIQENLPFQYHSVFNSN